MAKICQLHSPHKFRFSGGVVERKDGTAKNSLTQRTPRTQRSEAEGYLGKAPNSNLQAPEKFQSLNIQDFRRSRWWQEHAGSETGISAYAKASYVRLRQGYGATERDRPGRRASSGFVIPKSRGKFTVGKNSHYDFQSFPIVSNAFELFFKIFYEI